GLPVLQLHPARVSARRVPPRRVALIMALFVALLLSGLALARPGAGPDPVGAAMPATQSARSFAWLWGAFQVLGVMPLAPAGSTQSWRLELPPASEVTLANSPLTVVPVRWNGPAADCRPVAGGISCHNTSATFAFIPIEVTLPSEPGVYEVDGLGRSPADLGNQANGFLVVS